jgi:hypothetical protein
MFEGINLGKLVAVMWSALNWLRIKFNGNSYVEILYSVRDLINKILFVQFVYFWRY